MPRQELEMPDLWLIVILEEETRRWVFSPPSETIHGPVFITEKPPESASPWDAVARLDTLLLAV
jgi:hypothetical protein